MKRYLSIFVILLFSSVIQLRAEDGSRLWLRMPADGNAKVYAETSSKTIDIAINELKSYWRGTPVTLSIDKSISNGDGFVITKDNGIRIRASRDIGLLYGTYELLRYQQTNSLDHLSSKLNAPQFTLRILNHWDNLDGSIERGYAGKSIWKWDVIPVKSKGPKTDATSQLSTFNAQLTEYARANASIGINGTVINNVNASPKILTDVYINKVKYIADALRPYGIKVYLSINFASPITLGGLNTADPLNKKVREWWQKKTDEIYKIIPDFGGYLVKANSEGQPGPGDYHRTHADGANMLADALLPYRGVVMWRCFVYGNHQGEDRVMQAVNEFKPLDGQFRKNVILQAKNGPLDFQPREPYNPVFDQITKTPLMPEFQITQEYLGQSLHLVYLAPMWKEFFSYVSPNSMNAIAGVSNIGDDKDWCGHQFSQANWYAFGRLAWNPSLTSEEIAGEWLKQTFSDNSDFVNKMTFVMLGSRESCVDYMMPLGLHHIFKADHHYGPEPDGNQSFFPMEWRPVYYHKADTAGIGFDRSNSGTGAVSQYRYPYDSLYNNLKTCPEKYLLWFHHVPWTYQMSNGNTLWNNLCLQYNRGVNDVENYVDIWQQMKPYVDAERFKEVNDRLLIQLDNAKEWRKICLEYFQRFSNMPIVYYP